MNPVIITQQLAAPGVKVVRGPNWEWGNQDGGVGNIGVITASSFVDDTWVSVKWPNGNTHGYRVGADGKYDLQMHNPFETAGMLLQSPRPSLPNSQRVQEARKTLESFRQTPISNMPCVTKGEMNSLISKSNKHGHTNVRDTNANNAIKVRRPVIKIQGAKR